MYTLIQVHVPKLWLTRILNQRTETMHTSLDMLPIKVGAWYNKVKPRKGARRALGGALKYIESI